MVEMSTGAYAALWFFLGFTSAIAIKRILLFIFENC